MKFKKGEIYWIEFKNRNRIQDGSSKGFFRYIRKYYCKVGNNIFDAGLELYDYQTKQKDYAYPNLFKSETILNMRKATEQEKEILIENEI